MLVVQMLNAVYSVIVNNAYVHHHLLVIQMFNVNMLRKLVQRQMIVHRNIHATETFVRQRVEVIKVVWSMNVVYVVIVEQFVIVMRPVVKDKFVKIVYVKLVVELILSVHQMKLVSITSVQVCEQILYK